MMHNGTLNQINGCVSTGKEANVYHATNSETKEFAVKIFKTSILVFKDRDRYVSGEFRFRNGYGKGNPRKMVAVWAEKELRNLKRINMAGIPSPVPILQKQNVLLMTFLGHDGKAAPRLKDCNFEDPQTIYRQSVTHMRTMYQECRLVHGDYSEYNLLYHNDMVYVIDVGQAVEHDHPSSLSFLKRDIVNITDYFKRVGATVIGLNALFEYITDITPGTNEEKWDAACLLEESQAEMEFAETFVPRTL
jgi:RIO kinase 1